MAYENPNSGVLASGTAYNQYGPRDTQDSAVLSGGEIEGGGAEKTYVVYFDGDELGSADYDTGLTIPAGSQVVRATLEVLEAITMGHADNDIVVGTNGSAATNGADFDNTTGAVNTYAADALNGTWASEAVLDADTAVSLIVSGTTPGGTGGKGKITIHTYKAGAS